jgi:thiamine pyrophosphate-dependent acetolactate synthase large subunit-like protein
MVCTPRAQGCSRWAYRARAHDVTPQGCAAGHPGTMSGGIGYALGLDSADPSAPTINARDIPFHFLDEEMGP